MTAWIGIIGTIVGAILAGGAAWFNSRSQLRHQEVRERKKLFSISWKSFMNSFRSLDIHTP
jgi:ABC-type lipoprotein release transport system permease subunit